MDSEVTGVVTRSKAQAGAERRPEADTTCVTTIPRSEVVATSIGSRSSRLCREALRLRAEYKAEEELAKLKEQLIKKKLALEIAEIEDEVSENRAHSVCCSQNNVDEWLSSSQAPCEHADIPPASCAPAGACPTENLAQESARGSAHAPYATPGVRAFFEPAAAFSPSNTKYVPVAQPEVTTAGTVAASDIMHLADVIITNMTKRPRQNYDLPVFDGSPVDWLAYRRTYEATASTYSLFENTVRLQASLRGAAKCAVEGLLRTGSDPTDVIKALEEEFGHPNLLLENALHKIQSLPRVSDSGAELRNMTSVIRNCVYIPKNIKAEGYTYK